MRVAAVPPLASEADASSATGALAAPSAQISSRPPAWISASGAGTPSPRRSTRPALEGRTRCAAEGGAPAHSPAEPNEPLTSST